MFHKLQNTRYMQYLCAMAATLSSVPGSMHGYWTSPALVTLQSDNSPIGRPVTDSEGSWIVSLNKLAVLPAAILTAWLVEKIGRRYCLLIGAVLYVLPWFMIMFPTTVIVIYLSRICSGFGAGILSITCTIYVAEIGENDIRGRLGTTRIVFELIGSSLVLCIGPYVSYKSLVIIGASVASLYLCLIIFVPESPYYLVKSKKPQEAEEKLKILSSNAVDNKFIIDRMNEIENSIKEDMQNKTSVWEFLSNPEYRKPIFIQFGVKTLHQLSGIAAINGYMQTIIGLSGSNISEEASSIIFGLVQIPAAVATSVLVDKLGRKPLWIISAVGCGVALFAEGTFFYFEDSLGANISSIAWIPAAGLALFQIMNTLAIVPLPYIILGEIFPANIKGIAAGASGFYGGSLAFLVSKFFKPMSNAWGMHSMFFLFGSVCICGAVFVIFFLPETKGKSFTEIRAIMKNKKSKLLCNNKGSSTDIRKECII